MRIALAGAGAFGEKHLDGLKNIDGVEIASVISRRAEQAAEVAKKYGAPHSGTELSEALARDDVDAVILCTPTQMHAEQAIACMEAGKHVQVEIPLSDTWADAQRVLDKQQETGLVCMVGHTRRFNPSHQYVHNRILAGEFARRQFQRRRIDKDAPLHAAHAQPSDKNVRARCGFGRIIATAQQCAHAGHEFEHFERLEQVIIGAGVQPIHFVEQAVAGGQDQHGRHAIARTKLRQQRHTVDTGQPKIEDHQIVCLSRELFSGEDTVVHDMHAMPGLREPGMDAAGDGTVVFNQQDAH